MIIIDDIAQRTPEWLRLRLGVVTASGVDQILTPGRKLSAQRDKYTDTLIAEKLLSEPVEDWQGNYYTERGEELESEALAYFSLQTGMDPRPVAFVFRDESRDCGASPDGLIYDPAGRPAAGLEMKCPKASTHVGYLRRGTDKYNPQIQFSLWVTGLPLWYFLSYYPGLSPVLVPTLPDSAWQAAFSEHIPTFLAEMASAYTRIAGEHGEPAK